MNFVANGDAYSVLAKFSGKMCDHGLLIGQHHTESLIAKFCLNRRVNDQGFFGIEKNAIVSKIDRFGSGMVALLRIWNKKTKWIE